MKKIIAALMAVTMIAICLAGCSYIDSDDATGKGEIIDVYLGSKITNLDPATAYKDENAIKIISLIFEGLMSLDEDGKLSKALIDDYDIYEDEKTGETKMLIKINTTYWSDGSLVQTNDIAFAWERILDPDFNTEAAPLLYPIKGARLAKLGEIGINDIGISVISKNKIEITFEEGADTDEFLYNLASPAIVPLRQNKVSLYPDTWSRSSTDLSTNGAFRVRKFSSAEDEVMVLERSKYYYRNNNLKSETLDKSVTPYQIYVHYTEPLDLEIVDSGADTDIVTMYADGQITYVSGITACVADKFKSVKTSDVASTYVYYFNTSVAPFNNPTVRHALSIALDRGSIASDVGGGTKAATGFIPPLVFDSSRKNSFRKVGGELLSSSSNIDEARTILEEAGVNPAKYDDIYLYYLSDAVNDSYYSAQMGFKSKEKIAAEYVESAWEELGFSVVLKGVTSEAYEEAYKTNEFDVIGLDYQALSPYAIYALSQFATDYSGNTKLIESGDPAFDDSRDVERYYVNVPHKTGYVSEEYDALIESAFATSDQKERAKILHDAEALLIEDSPIIPVLFNADVYAVSDTLSGFDTNWFGAKLFKDVKVKNYMNTWSYLYHNNLLEQPEDEGSDEEAE